jgi:FixJ family two-component response regulator
MGDGPNVFVVDDDPSVRSSLKLLISSWVCRLRASTRLRPCCDESFQTHRPALSWMCGCAG